MAPVADTEFAAGWYLRGDVGYVHPGNVTEAAYGEPTPPMVHPKLSDAWSVGGGIGYRVNSWLRFDATVDYRIGSTFKGRNSGTGFVRGYSQESADFEATTALANAYVDLGTWSGITPYLGAGIGLSSTLFRNYVSQVVYFDGTPVPPFGYPGKRTNQLAYALMAGVGIDLGSGATLDVGYRYVHLGEVATRLDAFNVGTKMKDIDAHEIRAGLRWEFARPAPAVLAQAPVSARY
ncbi:outer membrane protein [Salinarimonas soli]|uniref:outer membrane protein n=1 Tax=Salinarimonas soli TaxID=1638099 RepID=UPI0023E883DE|nr:outer membrane protein [Salinarimonas soli]